MQCAVSHAKALRPAVPRHETRLLAGALPHGNRCAVSDVVSSPVTSEMNPWLTTQIVTPELRPAPLTGTFQSLDQDGRFCSSPSWRLSCWSQSLPSTLARITARLRSRLTQPQPRLPQVTQQQPHRRQQILPHLNPSHLQRAALRQNPLLQAALKAMLAIQLCPAFLPKTQRPQTELSRKGADLTSGRGALRPSAFLVLKARTC